jgi:hypothetical protein
VYQLSFKENRPTAAPQPHQQRKTQNANTLTSIPDFFEQDTKKNQKPATNGAHIDPLPLCLGLGLFSHSLFLLQAGLQKRKAKSHEQALATLRAQ